MPSSKNLHDVTIAALATLVICIFISAFIGFASIVGLVSFLVTVVAWGYVLFIGTNRSALNSPSYSMSREEDFFHLFCLSSS